MMTMMTVMTVMVMMTRMTMMMVMMRRMMMMRMMRRRDYGGSFCFANVFDNSETCVARPAPLLSARVR